jgi:hypothetical protein
MTLPALAMVLAAHPLGRKLIGAARRIDPKSMATIEESRIPFFFNPVAREEARRGLGGSVGEYRGPLEELVSHPRVREFRRGDPTMEVKLPMEAAEEGAKYAIVGRAPHPVPTTVMHELQHAAGAAENIEKAKGLPTGGDLMRGSLHFGLQQAPSVGSELVQPAMKDFPDLPHMYASYRANRYDPGVALGELLNEYIARVRSGLPREQNLIFGPYGVVPSEAFWKPRLDRFRPELEEIVANRPPHLWPGGQTPWFTGPESKQPFSVTGWDLVQEALNRANRPR